MKAYILHLMIDFLYLHPSTGWKNKSWICIVTSQGIFPPPASPVNSSVQFPKNPNKTIVYNNFYSFVSESQFGVLNTTWIFPCCYPKGRKTERHKSKQTKQTCQIAEPKDS